MSEKVLKVLFIGKFYAVLYIRKGDQKCPSEVRGEEGHYILKFLAFNLVP
jgi:hypothetical protein